MASSAHDQQHHDRYGGATSAPPPTPSTQPNILSTSDAADALSRLLHRLPPTLSLPTRRASPPASASSSPPLVSLSDPNPTTLRQNLISASKLGFFQLTDHSIPPDLAQSAEVESLRLFDLPREHKQLIFPKNWPIGFDDDDDEESSSGDSFCIDSAFSTESSELCFSSLREFAGEMEKIGLAVVQAIAGAVGFRNPDSSRICSLMWISECLDENGTVGSGRFYPYVVGLQYQIRCQKYSLLAESGWAAVSPQVDSVLVTLGDIAQVWSNGKLKKVRGRPVPSTTGDSKNSHRISMSLLLTLPLESPVSPLHSVVAKGDGDEEVQGYENAGDSSIASKEAMMFNSFCFEDYAWRVYHERLLLKDPLDRYRL